MLDDIEQEPLAFGQCRPQTKSHTENPEWFPWPHKAVSP